MPGKGFLAPLFSENKKLYSYNLPLSNVRSIIEKVFAQSEGVFRGTDVRGRFTGANTFQMDSPVRAGPPVLRSTLYGALLEQNGGTQVEARIAPAISLKIWFWLSMAMGLGYLAQVLITGDHSIWTS